MNKKTIAMVAIVLAVGVATTMAVLRMPPAKTASTEETEGPGPLDYPRGPHGARLLSDDGLQVEMTIYETGVPPQYRVYPYDASQKPVSPSEVDLVVELHRLGGRVDRITFTPEADYLRGNEVVEEPHSFDVTVAATRAGRQHAWSYSQIEGKVELGPDQIKSAGITIGTVGPREMTTSLELPGEVKVDETRVAHVVPRLQGVVDQVLKKEGDRVGKGEVIAVMSSRELADAKRDYIEAAHDAEYRATIFAREEMLWQKKISAEQDYRLAEKLAEEAQLAKKLAGQKLIVLGVPGNTLEGLA
jgi:membrane fusion protein, heavy metal efflux system